jgi:hypothetical protein
MKKPSILLLAALLPLVACQTSEKEVPAESPETSETANAMAMASFELGKVP